MISVEAFGQLDPLLDFHLLLLPLTVVHYLSEQLIHYLLGGVARFFLCCLHCVFVVFLIVTEVETCDDIVERIFGFRC